MDLPSRLKSDASNHSQSQPQRQPPLQQQQPPSPPTLNIPSHIRYWLHTTTFLPPAYQSQSSNLLSLAFFTLSALDLLGLLDSDSTHPKAIPISTKKVWIDWIYSLQCPEGGFRGSKLDDLGGRRSLWNRVWDGASLANSFLGLLGLVMLGDDLERARKTEWARWLRGLQSPEGGFGEELRGGSIDGIGGSGEDDMRMCYCAAGIQYILGEEYECLNREALRRYVGTCQGFEGGVGQGRGQEGHSGLGYCAVGCLELLGRMDRKGAEDDVDVQGLVRYCCGRQTSWVDDDEEEEQDEESDEGGDGQEDGRDDSGVFLQEEQTPVVGFCGRANKMADTCYCYWNLGTLDVLGLVECANVDGVRRYLLETTQYKIGGFMKSPGEHPDMMHSYLGLAALSVMGEAGLKELDSALSVSVDVRRRIGELSWRKGKT